jgi:hypothetical protein|tara:strand:- start:1333 stop:1791 length:459 start_codon:yes stop_codon:yes gene_type:complete
MSCKFNGKISAEFTPPKTWVLEKALSFTVEGHGISSVDLDILQEIGANVANTGRVTCKKGMKTDLASVPRICWALLAPWDVARAAVIHDHLYAACREYKKSEGYKYSTWKKARALSDKIFLLGMKAADPGVPAWKVYPAYWSVRVFGCWAAS